MRKFTVEISGGKQTVGLLTVVHISFCRRSVADCLHDGP